MHGCSKAILGSSHCCAGYRREVWKFPFTCSCHREADLPDPVSHPTTSFAGCRRSMLEKNGQSCRIRRRQLRRAASRDHIASISSHPLSSLSYSSAMSFARTALRTSRALRSHSSSPVQCALSQRAQSQFLNSSRCYATAFERSKPHVNIGTIGHVDHGKASLPVTDPSTPLPLLTLASRPPSPQPSPNARPKRATPAISSTAPSTRPPRSASEASPSPPPTSNTKPTAATTPTSTAPATPTTSRT